MAGDISEANWKHMYISTDTLPRHQKIETDCKKFDKLPLDY